MPYIQYGNILIRDAPNPSPPHAFPGGPAWRPRQRVDWGGVSPLWIYPHVRYRILDINICIHIKCYVYIYIYTLAPPTPMVAHPICEPLPGP